MTENEFATLKAQGKVKSAKKATEPPVEQGSRPDTGLATYLAVLQLLQRPRRPVSSAPTFIPKNFAEQVQFYENGTTRRLYVYINNAWRYVTLT